MIVLAALFATVSAGATVYENRGHNAYTNPKAHEEARLARYHEKAYKFKERAEIEDEVIHHDHEAKLEDHADFLKARANELKEHYREEKDELKLQKKKLRHEGREFRHLHHEDAAYKEWHAKFEHVQHEKHELEHHYHHHVEEREAHMKTRAGLLEAKAKKQHALAEIHDTDAKHDGFEAEAWKERKHIYERESGRHWV